MQDLKKNPCNIILMLGILTLNILAQDSTAVTDWSRSQAPHVFIDCSHCDIDYIRTEINYINYVWDRKHAEIHVLINRESTGGGGRKYTLSFIGREKFRNMQDTLTYFTNQNMTDDQIRQGIVHTLQMGLMRYIAKTPLAENLVLEVYTESAPVIRDKWNNWVFEIDMFSRVKGQQTEKIYDLYGSFAAERITPEWKIELETEASYERELFSYTNEQDQKVETRSMREYWQNQAHFIKSISNHWSLGLFSEISASSYRNIDQNFNIYPGIEYNIFPYAQSTHREIRLQYRLGYEYYRYIEETIYKKSQEKCPRNQLISVIEFTQPWGDFETRLEVSAYLNDISKNRIELFSDLEIYLVKGLSLDLYGRYSIIHDQIYLSQADLSAEEILLRQRDMETSYRYEFRIGLSYAFGSIYNNVVNPRFDRY